ncbi:hypothetical protein D3C84_1253470 [compost metagenome]
MVRAKLQPFLRSECIVAGQRELAAGEADRVAGRQLPDATVDGGVRIARIDR